MTDEQLSARRRAVLERVRRAALAADRDPDSIRVVAVTKGHPVGVVAALRSLGHLDVGENRVQELLAKHDVLGGGESVASEPGFSESGARAAPGGLRWHFVGQVQRNKVARVAQIVDLWHGVDRSQLVHEIARRRPGAEVLLQVNVAGEAQKGGVAPGDLEVLAVEARDAGLAVRGLMTVPPAGEDPQPHFRSLRHCAESLGLAELSMGMSGDFEAAIAEGATLVRIGTALVGSRG